MVNEGVGMDSPGMSGAVQRHPQLHGHGEGQGDAKATTRIPHPLEDQDDCSMWTELTKLAQDLRLAKVWRRPAHKRLQRLGGGMRIRAFHNEKSLLTQAPTAKRKDRHSGILCRERFVRSCIVCSTQHRGDEGELDSIAEAK